MNIRWLCFMVLRRTCKFYSVSTKKNISWRESQKWMRWRTLNGRNIQTVDYRMHYISFLKKKHFRVSLIFFAALFSAVSQTYTKCLNTKYDDDKNYSNEFYFQNGISSDLYWVCIFVATLFVLSKLNCGDWIYFFISRIRQRVVVFFSLPNKCWQTAFLYEHHVTMIWSSCSDGKTNIKHMIIHHLCGREIKTEKTAEKTACGTQHLRLFLCIQIKVKIASIWIMSNTHRKINKQTNKRTNETTHYEKLQ